MNMRNTKAERLKPEKKRRKIKDMAISSPELFVGTFDLQAVLQTPCSLVSQLYYMIKLNCYNLSIYNLASTHATCYLWSEVDAQRGSCEIGKLPSTDVIAKYQNTCNILF